MLDLKRNVNYEEGIARLNGNSVLYKTLLQSYQKNTYWKQLKSEVESGDLEAAQNTAHAIKGIAGSLSLENLYHISEQLYRRLKEGAAYRGSVEEMEVIVENTLNSIEKVIETI